MKEISEVEFLKLKNIKTPTEFSRGVKALKITTGLSWIEAVLEYCQKYQIEEDTVPNMLTGELKSRIFDEAKELNFFPKSWVLPI